MNSCFLGVQAQAYKEKIKQAAGEKNFSPLMTLYLTDNTAPEEIYRAKEGGVVALKMYPAGATTNSDSGVTDWRKCKDTLRAMQEVRVFPFNYLNDVSCLRTKLFEPETVKITLNVNEPLS